jgi:DDE superfamily endonuclease
MTAVRSLRDKVVFWPDEAERQEIANRVCRDFCFPNCVGFIDGTLFPLSKCPSTEDAPDYSGRKFSYSLSTLIINDDSRLIRYYLAGWPGSAHDDHVWTNCAVAQRPDEFFWIDSLFWVIRRLKTLTLWLAVTNARKGWF